LSLRSKSRKTGKSTCASGRKGVSVLRLAPAPTAEKTTPIGAENIF